MSQADRLQTVLVIEDDAIVGLMATDVDDR